MRDSNRSNQTKNRSNQSNNDSSDLRDENGQFTSEGAEEFGQEGGESTSKKHGPEFYQEIGKKGAKERWENENRQQGEDNQ